MNAELDNRKASNLVINTISIVIPAIIVVLLAFPNKVALGEWTKALPHVIGSVNSLTTIFLICGLIAIKANRISLHRLSMGTAFSLGIVFLFCYMTYHVSNPSNRFTGTGAVRYLYFAVLLTHVLLSFVVLPLVLRAMYFALKADFKRHKKVVRYAYPIWLYVSATGVAVYLMLYQLYPAK